MEIRHQLPAHEVPAGARERVGSVLRVGGLVARPLVLEASGLASFRRAEHTEAFTCEEGWSVPGQRWRGIRLRDIVALAGPLPSARYVRVCAGEYAVPVPLEDADRALLCDGLNGQPLTLAHGAPWRLFVPGRQCFTSVKWVDRLEVTADSGPSDGERIARARLMRAHGDHRTAALGRDPDGPDVSPR
jgi:DMSO/TMAO reductase YedYZ molybdopterin-dependent catalytic subunit